MLIFTTSPFAKNRNIFISKPKDNNLHIGITWDFAIIKSSLKVLSSKWRSGYHSSKVRIASVRKKGFAGVFFNRMLVCLTYLNKNPHRYLLKLEHGVSTKIPGVQIILLKKMYEKSKVVITSCFFGLDNRTKLTKLWNAKRWKYKNGICFGLATWDGWKEYSENSSYTWAYKYHIYYGHTHNTWSKSSHANPVCSVKDYDFPDLNGVVFSDSAKHLKKPVPFHCTGLVHKDTKNTIPEYLVLLVIYIG